LSFDILGLSFSEKLKKTALHAIGLLGRPFALY